MGKVVKIIVKIVLFVNFAVIVVAVCALFSHDRADS